MKSKKRPDPVPSPRFRIQKLEERIAPRNSKWICQCAYGGYTYCLNPAGKVKVFRGCRY